MEGGPNIYQTTILCGNRKKLLVMGITWLILPRSQFVSDGGGDRLITSPVEVKWVSAADVQ